MAAGDLSSDQLRYVDRVASGTRLDRTVVVAWVGAESGWNANKAGHNYLNVGPGETYPSTDQAGARVVGLISASSNYAGIRAAIPAGPAAQIKAIGESPWGTSASVLTSVYQQLASKSGGTINITPVVELVPGIPIPLPDSPLPGIHIPLPDPLQKAADAAGNIVGGAAADVASAVAKAIGPVLLEAGLGIVFTVAAFAFIAMGVNRLTGAPPKGIFDTVSGAVGTVAGASKLAAL